MSAGDESMSMAQAEKLVIEKAYDSSASKINELRTTLAKNELALHKQRVDGNAGIFTKRAEVTREIKHFWLTTFQKSPELQRLLDPKDLPVLEQLTDLSLAFAEDPREFTATFTFAKNDYFSDETIVKSYKLVDLPSDIPADSPGAYSLDRPLEGTPTTINWTDDAHNLVKLRPRIDPNAMEEFDEFTSLGSFFCLFSETEDALGVAEALLQTFAEAHDIFAGLVESADDSDDDADDGKSFDLGDDSDDDAKPKAKRPRKA